MSVRAVMSELFEPARYPPPALDGLALSWRYVLAGGSYLFYAATMVMLGVSPELAAPEMRDPLTDAPQLPPWPLPVVDLVLGALALVAIRWRRRWPLAVFVALDLVSLMAPSAGLTSLWAFLSLCSRRQLPKIGVAMAVSAAVAIADRFLPWNQRSMAMISAEENGSVLMLGGWVASVVVMIVLALFGMYHGTRQDRTAGVQDRIDNAERDRELAVLSERNRIAREMHDVLAHRISLVSMHAGVLAFRDDLEPAKTREIAAIIQENAHASLTELRSVLSTLRESQVDAAGALAAPQPTLDDVGALLEEARRLGQHVTWRPLLDVAAVPPVASRHLYRIVQECLTNARKHAPYAHVEATVGGSAADGISLRVTNPLVPRGGQIPGAGLGLVGLRERASMLGGHLNADVVGQEFVVTAHMPWPS